MDDNDNGTVTLALFVCGLCADLEGARGEEIE